MRIGIDARELAGRPTGVGRLLGGLLREWSSDDAVAAHEFVLYAPEPLGITLEGGRFRTHLVPGASGTWWEQIQLPRAVRGDKLDVFFAPAYTAPIRIETPTVVLIHDLSYVARPDWFRLREGLRRRLLTRWTAGRARTILTDSEFSRGEIIERLGVPADRVRVVVPGIERRGVQPSSSTDPRVLYVGSIFNRRHVPDLIRAVAAIARRHPHVTLDLVGDNRSFPYEDLDGLITRLALDGRVRWHRYATSELLLELYGQARAFAFLSEYEGLGLPPLEALDAGVPPVLYDTPIARESCGRGALYVPIGDQATTERAIEHALFDEETRGRILAAAPLVLDKYDWPRAARETLMALEVAATSPAR